MEFRCESRIHGVVTTDGVIIFRCHSKRCGHGKGVVVEHHFVLVTGEFLETKKFREPDEGSEVTQQKEDEACRL